MADSTVHFDTPQTGSIYSVQATGTLVPHYVGYVTLDLKDINNSTTFPRTSATHFKKTFPLSNTTSLTTTYNITTTLTIVPKRETRDTVTLTWGLSQTP
ncbi:hypothetical protein [Clostridium folliculivorans]|uniref:Uncharacterized protein n=1 Tax=Clostridium folliculivorans TaxID=2886038 RepID=A0A9W6DB80_9CLOT|nr:hypothetical protein [Clostridium folliculivorans]GKU25994.1 hypothetical protein CFOLD11_28210 [Clostridium folliculivorans]GKU28080.1 hypothetical protein CFB3_01860 [Clostridium folliculivorans]